MKHEDAKGFCSFLAELDILICGDCWNMNCYQSANLLGIISKDSHTVKKCFLQPHSSIITPWEITMEPSNHPIEKENHLPSTSIVVSNPFIFMKGVSLPYYSFI